ncbi:hypothetical protein TNCV_4930991 [Trichonephila clavipes]|nr:hypothetical protein TNCV_4930991 [Trichonephila clavipes]
MRCNGSRYKSSCFKGVRPRSNESQYSRNNGSGERREVKEKVTGLKEDLGQGTWELPVNADHLSDHHPILGPERKRGKGQVHQSDKRKLTSSKSSSLTHFRKQIKREETSVSDTCRYNLRQRRDENVESRPSSDKRSHQRGPVRSRGRREQQYSPYAVEQGRSCSRSSRSRRAQQQQNQESREGVNSQISVARGARRRRQLQDTKIRSMYYLRISPISPSAVIIGHPTHIPISSSQILITTRTPYFLA